MGPEFVLGGMVTLPLTDEPLLEARFGEVGGWIGSSCFFFLKMFMEGEGRMS